MNPRTSAFGRLLLAGAFAIFAAACTKTEQVTQTPPVTVTVVPTTATLTVGQTTQFAANVSGGSATTDKTVTWSSSAASVASVDANGVVTGVAAGNAVITATAAGSSGNATVNVVLAPPKDTINSITIKGITQTGNANATVNPNDIDGSIDVTLNVDASPGAVSAVKLFVDSTQACEQILNAATSVNASKPAAQQSQQSVVCTVNTAGYDTASASPLQLAPMFLNGPHTLVAKAYDLTGAVATTAQIGGVFNNANDLIVTLTPDTSAINPTTGLKWVGGNLLATALPIMYSGGTIARVTFSLNVIGGNQVDATPADGFTWMYPADSTASATLPGTKGITDSNAQVYASTVTSTGSNGPTGYSSVERLDNQAPASVGFTLHPDLNFAWMNASSKFMSMIDTTVDNTGAGRSGSVDAGVGGVTYSFMAGPAPDSLASVSVGGDLADSQDSLRYMATVTISDLLGNSVSEQVRYTPGSAASDTAHFGVDTQPPVISFSTITSQGTQVLPDTTLTAYPVLGSTNFVVEYQDSGYSGFATTTPVQATEMMYDTAGTHCEWGVGATCTPFSDDGFTPLDSIGADGYFVYSGYVQDEAGNTSPTVTRRALVDVTLPHIGLDFAGPTTLKGGQSATFTVSGLDNLDFASSTADMSYAGGTTAYKLDMGSQSFGTYGQDVLTDSVVLSNTMNPFIRGIADQSAPAAFSTVQGVDYSLADVAGNTATGFGPITSPPAPTQTWAGFVSWQYTGANGVATPPAPSTLEATLVVSSATTQNSYFASVRFYELNASGVWTYLGSAGSPQITDNQSTGQRSFRYQMAAPAFSTGAHTVVAIGVDANGDALASQQVTITAP